jgi:hypothetical protein
MLVGVGMVCGVGGGWVESDAGYGGEQLG